MAKPASITKEMVTSAAFDMARNEGFDALSARTLADKLNCSTQPIYNIFENMNTLKSVILNMLGEFMMEQITHYKKTDCAFLNSGLGYIQFARTEKHLFALFSLKSEGHNLIKSDEGNAVIRMLMEQELEGKSLTTAHKDKIFLQTMIFTYGMAVLAYLDNLFLSEDEISDLLYGAFEGYIQQAHKGEIK